MVNILQEILRLFWILMRSLPQLFNHLLVLVDLIIQFLILLQALGLTHEIEGLTLLMRSFGLKQSKIVVFVFSVVLSLIIIS